LIDELLAGQGPPPTTLRDWFAESHRLQQLALEHGIEWLLSQRPRCMGILLWQFNEMWPGLSWSLIDADGRPKPAWHTVRQLFAS
jgi:beta-mannosidase